MDSVANVSQIIALDRQILTEWIGQVSEEQLDSIIAGIDVVLGRSNPAAGQ
jgi:mRNA-degrading endonuclease toxin of MazEF toxin-antitoxin module